MSERPDGQPAVTIAIATLGRADKLARVLDACERLACETPPFEVVVVVDGHDPASAAAAARPRPFAVRCFAQPRAGAGPARNRAAAEARGELLLFLNDDTRPCPGCLVQHANAHRRHGPCLTEGLVSWDPETVITPYMRWLAPAGHQYNYTRLADGGRIPWDAVWTTNLAVPRAWVLDCPFDAGIPPGCLEDTEWAYRQYRLRRHAVFVRAAEALHDHRYDGPGDYRSRARLFGAAARYVARRHPLLAWRFVARPLAAAAARAASLALPLRRRHELLWDLDFRLNYLAGLARVRSGTA
jgi:glycosyltransferase involved in cell wall biosynthesis